MKRNTNFPNEKIYSHPVSYGKERVAGSNIISYLLHSKGACMPGNSKKFTPYRLSKPDQRSNLKTNQIISDYKFRNLILSRLPNGLSLDNKSPKSYIIDRFSPHDDESLLIAINASYRQVYGNFQPMESEKNINLERRLRDGDITIKEFIRLLAKSNFYKKHYFETVSQKNSIELAYKHLLGRPPYDHLEIRNCIESINKESFEVFIDLILDSEEYYGVFGEDIVPYNRCWQSITPLITSSFIKGAYLQGGISSSDNATQSLHNN